MLFRQLPRRLITYFGILDSTAEALLNGIIGCRSLIAVDGILRDAGVVEVDRIARRPAEPRRRIFQPNSDVISQEDDTPATIETQTFNSGQLNPVATTETAHASPQIEEDELESVLHSHGSASIANRDSLPSRPLPPQPEGAALPIPLVGNDTEERNYAALLGRVIRSADRMTLPAQGTPAWDSLPAQLPLFDFLFHSVFGARSSERNNRVGAAGELFVSNTL
jgi:hypothetical protein